MYSDQSYTISQAEMIAKRLVERMQRVTQLGPQDKPNERETFDITKFTVNDSAQVVTLKLASRTRKFERDIPLFTAIAERALHNRPGTPIQTLNPPSVLY